jgi:aminopeptidase
MLGQDIINNMVEAMDIKKDELILLHFWGEDNEREMLHMFEYAVVRIGAMPISLHQSRSNNAELFHYMENDHISEKYYSIFDKVDTVIDICMYVPVIPGENMTKVGMVKYKDYMRQLFKVLSSKSKFVQIRIPTTINAEESNLETEDFINRMEDAYNIDYKNLKTVCLSEINKLKEKNQLVLTTGADCRLSFDTRGRQWHMDAGDGDFPCGEVYIAPNEELTNGTIFFKKFYWEEEAYDDVILTIEKGMIVNSNYTEINVILDELPDGGRVVGELGIGMNYNVTELCGYSALDEKMKGTVHIGIGMNQMFGGNNSAPLHMDFVCEGNWTLS